MLLYLTYYLFVDDVIDAYSFLYSVMNKILIVNINIFLESATYNCPCEKTYCGTYNSTLGMLLSNPTISVVCPCTLFVIIEKHIFIKKYF